MKEFNYTLLSPGMNQTHMAGSTIIRIACTKYLWTRERLNPDLDIFLHPWYIFSWRMWCRYISRKWKWLSGRLVKESQIYVCSYFYCSNAIIASASADVSNVSNMILCYPKYASLKFVLRPKYFLEAIASLYFFVMKFAATYVLFVTGWAQV